MPSSSLAILQPFMCISEISKHCDLICVYFSVLIHVIHNEYTHTGPSEGSPPLYSSMFNCSHLGLDYRYHAQNNDYITLQLLSLNFVVVLR